MASKIFTYTMRGRFGELIATRVIEFGSADCPFPKDWKSDINAQYALQKYIDRFIEETITVTIEEGDTAPKTPTPDEPA